MESSSQTYTLSNFLAVLKNRQFLKLWFSQVASQLSLHMTIFALMVRIFNITNTSTSVGILIVFYGAPSLLFSALAGAFVDRHSRKKALFITNLLQAVTILLGLFFGKTIALILIFAFLYNLFNQWFAPAESASIPTLVDKDHLFVANSLFALTLYGGFIGGYIIAGPLMTLFGNNAPFWVSATLLFLATIAVFFLPTDKGPIKEDGKHIFKNILSDTREGFSFIKNHPIVGSSLFKFGLTQIILSTIFVLGPGFMENVLGIKVQDLSLVFMAPAGLGVAIGAVIAGKLSKKVAKRTLMNWGIISLGITLALVAGSKTFGVFLKYQLLDGSLPLNSGNILPLVIFMFVVLGIENAFILIPAQTIMQKNTPHEVRGRVWGVLGMLITAGAALPVLTASILADILSVTAVLVGVGVLVFLYGVLSLRFDAKRI